MRDEYVYLEPKQVYITISHKASQHNSYHKIHIRCLEVSIEPSLRYYPSHLKHSSLRIPNFITDNKLKLMSLQKIVI